LFPLQAPPAKSPRGRPTAKNGKADDDDNEEDDEEDGGDDDDGSDFDPGSEEDKKKKKVLVLFFLISLSSGLASNDRILQFLRVSIQTATYL